MSLLTLHPVNMHLLLIVSVFSARSVLAAAFSPVTRTQDVQSSLPVAAKMRRVAPLHASSSTREGSGQAAAGIHRKEPLASSFPPGLPAGLRGEAVRSALRSPNGICIDFTRGQTQDPGRDAGVDVGVVKVQGSGVQQFLEGKLSNSFGSSVTSDSGNTNLVGRVVDACLLTTRGRAVDRITVPEAFAVGDDAMEAYMITSPGHGGSALFNRLDPFVFPMDGVKLIDMMNAAGGCSTRVFTVAATKMKHVRDTVQKFVLPNIQLCDASIADVSLPKRGQCTRISSGSNEVVILASTFLPECICTGYTFIISEDDSSSSFTKVWDALTAKQNEEAPVELGPLEWDTLRIEGGWPAYAWEMTGDADPNSTADIDSTRGDAAVVGVAAKASPLELHLDSTIDQSKGCFLGQEAVAALLMNKRGMPRTLYSVVFQDDENAYNDNNSTENMNDDTNALAALLRASKDGSSSSNFSNSGAKSKDIVARQPLPGDEIFVLGSAGKIRAGMITSVAESGGTGDPTTVALALIRRPDSILGKMESMGIELGGGIEDPTNDELPPPVDPLDGLEVMIDGTNTIGKLRSVPWRRYKHGLNMFDLEVEAFRDLERDGGSLRDFTDANNAASRPSGDDAADFVPVGWDAADDEMKATDEQELRLAEEEAARAAAEAEAAVTEAKRKVEKMEMLKKKAEAALARRRKKKKPQS